MGALRYHECRLELIAGMHVRYERVCAVLGYFDGQNFSEALGNLVLVAEHNFALPPPHHVDGVWVHLILE